MILFIYIYVYINKLIDELTGIEDRYEAGQEETSKEQRYYSCQVVSLRMIAMIFDDVNTRTQPEVIMIETSCKESSVIVGTTAE